MQRHTNICSVFQVRFSLCSFRFTVLLLPSLVLRLQTYTSTPDLAVFSRTASGIHWYYCAVITTICPQNLLLFPSRSSVPIDTNLEAPASQSLASPVSLDLMA